MGLAIARDSRIKADTHDPLCAVAALTKRAVPVHGERLRSADGGAAMRVGSDEGRTISVLIVDDHPMLREGIAAILQGEADIKVVGDAGTGREAIAAFEQLRPAVVLMDAQMPDLDGVAATAAIRSSWPDARVLMLTTYGGDALALRALKAGASGYLLKSMIRTELLEAIRAVDAGRRHIPRVIADELAAHVTDDLLSGREVEVLRRVAAGNTNRRISEQLFISEDTVKAHLKNIMSKLSARDRTHAVVIAVKRGIIDV
jgi:DNA-binding NarL/FixJ family response regulator